MKFLKSSVTPERAALHTRFHPRCGTSFILIVALLAILIYAISDTLYAVWTGHPPTLLTRFGMRSRMVICGDPHQVDLPGPSKSGVAGAVGKLERVKGISVVRFSALDVVRHPLVGRIVEAYEGPGR